MVAWVWTAAAAALIATASQFYAGYLTRCSLSLDNLFVFAVIMTWSRCRLPASPGSCCSEDIAAIDPALVLVRPP